MFLYVHFGLLQIFIDSKLLGCLEESFCKIETFILNTIEVEQKFIERLVERYFFFVNIPLGEVRRFHVVCI